MPPRGRRRAVSVLLAVASVAVAQTATKPSREPAMPQPAAAAAAAEALHQEAEARLAGRSPGDLAIGLRLFGEATELDRGHARAHAGIAISATLLALYGVEPPGPLLAKARAASTEALRLDPSLARVQAAAGLVHYLAEWDAPTAEVHLRHALRLDPTLADGWHWYGMMLYAIGRFDEAVAAFDRALGLEPGSSLFATKRAVVLAATGRAGDAERELRAASSRFPAVAMPRRELGYLLVDQGRHEEGLAMLMWAAELGGGLEADPALAWGLARSGRRVGAKAILANLENRSEGFVAPTDLALVHTGLGQLDRAFDGLERALAARDPGLVYLESAAQWKPLRGDERFDALLAGIALVRSGGGAAAASLPLPTAAPTAATPEEAPAAAPGASPRAEEP